MAEAVAVGPGSGVHTVRAHHGELLQGLFEENGRWRRGLVTLPCPLYRTTAGFTLTEAAAVSVTPSWRVKARRAAALALEALGHPGQGGRLQVVSDVPPGRGFGSSSADVTASIAAVSAALGRPLSRSAAARLAVRAEVASDPLMYGDHVVLFAQREGRVLEHLGARLPAMVVLGCHAGHRRGEVDTLALPRPRYPDGDLAAFRDALGMLREAVRNGDAAALGEAATISSRINQRHVPLPYFEDLLDIAGRAGAAGVQVAHSGDIAGLLFDAAVADLAARLDVARATLRQLGIGRSWEFRTGT